MKISNKLNKADFMELQKIVMGRHDPGMGATFLLKYLSNFLYSIVIFLGSYFIISRLAGVDSWIIPAIIGILSFTLLVYFFPKFYQRRLTRVIERFYAKASINIERDLVLDDEGFLVTDEKGEKHFAWKDFDFIVRSAGNYFMKLNGKQEGFVIKADHLEQEEVARLEGFIVNSGQTVEEKNHE